MPCAKPTLNGGEQTAGSEDAEDPSRRFSAENERLSCRLQRLGPVLASMARDLALVRRENASLKRENLRLQGLLGTAKVENPVLEDRAARSAIGPRPAL